MFALLILLQIHGIIHSSKNVLKNLYRSNNIFKLIKILYLNLNYRVLE